MGEVVTQARLEEGARFSVERLARRCEHVVHDRRCSHAGAVDTRSAPADVAWLRPPLHERSYRERCPVAAGLRAAHDLAGNSLRLPLIAVICRADHEPRLQQPRTEAVFALACLAFAGEPGRPATRAFALQERWPPGAEARGQLLLLSSRSGGADFHRMSLLCSTQPYICSSAAC